MRVRSPNDILESSYGWNIPWWTEGDPRQQRPPHSCRVCGFLHRGPVKRLDIAHGPSIVYRVLSSDEGKDGLRCGIGLREGGRPGLLQDLQLDKLHLLLGEVGVVDTAARGFIVVHGRLQVILLEGEAFLAVGDVSQPVGQYVDCIVASIDGESGILARADVPLHLGWITIHQCDTRAFEHRTTTSPNTQRFYGDIKRVATI